MQISQTEWRTTGNNYTMNNELSFLIAFAAVFGASEAIKQIQSDARRKEHRSRKNNLIVRCLKSCQYSSTLEGRRVVLSGDKVRIVSPTYPCAPLNRNMNAGILTA